MKLFRREFLAGAASLALCGLASAPAHAQTNQMAPAAGAPRRVVIVVAEGLSQPLIDFAAPYARTTQDAEDATVAFDTLKMAAQNRPAPANALEAMRGLLKTAAQHGYKTGLVTTGDAAQTAGLFYDLPKGTEAAALAGGTVPFDVLGGGGRADFNAAQRAGLKAAGITALLDSDAFENTDQEVKGRVLALQADASLAFEVDRDAASEAGLGDLASYAMERLGADNAPYLLVIHDTLLARAIEAKDTVALLNQFRALNAIAGNVLSARTDDPALGLVMLATGSPTLPRFTSARAEDQTNSFFVASNLPLSFTRAGQMLQGVNEAALTQFIEEQYTDYKPDAADRAALLAGQLAPEAALRKAYEPALQIAYEPGDAPATTFSIGVTGEDPIAALQQMAAQPAK